MFLVGLTLNRAVAVAAGLPNATPAQTIRITQTFPGMYLALGPFINPKAVTQNPDGDERRSCNKI